MAHFEVYTRGFNQLWKFRYVTRISKFWPYGWNEFTQVGSKLNHFTIQIWAGQPWIPEDWCVWIRIFTINGIFGFRSQNMGHRAMLSNQPTMEPTMDSLHIYIYTYICRLGSTEYWGDWIIENTRFSWFEQWKIIVFVVTWTPCCLRRRRRRGISIPYQ